VGLFDGVAVKRLLRESGGVGYYLGVERMLTDPVRDAFKQAFDAAAAEVGRDKALAKAVNKVANAAMNTRTYEERKWQQKYLPPQRYGNPLFAPDLSFIKNQPPKWEPVNMLASAEAEVARILRPEPPPKARPKARPTSARKKRTAEKTKPARNKTANAKTSATKASPPRATPQEDRKSGSRASHEQPSASPAHRPR
jgi:hypothetical protein